MNKRPLFIGLFERKRTVRGRLLIGNSRIEQRRTITFYFRPVECSQIGRENREI